jgi:hypothetical protein
MLSPKVINAFQSKWEIKKAELKIKFPRLTDADLNFDEDEKNKMLVKLAVRLTMTTRELGEIIDRYN